MEPSSQVTLLLMTYPLSMESVKVHLELLSLFFTLAVYIGIIYQCIVVSFFFFFFLIHKPIAKSIRGQL